MSELLTLATVGTPVLAGYAGARVARVRAPRLYWSAIGLPIAATRLTMSYRSVMDACGLSTDPTVAARAMARMRHGIPARSLPRRRRFRPSTMGFRLRLRMRPGQTPDDFAAATERLRHAWGVPAVHVHSPGPGWVELRVVGWDVLSDVRMPKTAPADLLRFAVALCADGTVHTRDYRAVPHQLVIGATQSGKSVFQRNLVAGLAPQSVALVGIDCKWGVELAPYAARLSALAVDPDQADELLAAMVEEMENRYHLIRKVQGIGAGVEDAEITSDIWGLPEHLRPVPIVLIVDEIAELFLTANKADEERRARLVTALIRLAQLGRAAGMYVEACGQRFGSDLGKGATMLRAQLTGRVCHRVNDSPSAEMAFGDIAAEAAQAATSIPADRPGLAVAGDSSGGWSLIRTPHRTIGDVARICADTAHLVPDLPALAPFAPAITLAVVDLDTAIDALVAKVGAPDPVA